MRQNLVGRKVGELETMKCKKLRDILILSKSILSFRRLVHVTTFINKTDTKVTNLSEIKIATKIDHFERSKKKLYSDIIY